MHHATFSGTALPFHYTITETGSFVPVLSLVWRSGAIGIRVFWKHLQRFLTFLTGSIPKISITVIIDTNTLLLQVPQEFDASMKEHVVVSHVVS